MAKLWIWNVASTAWKKVSESNPLPTIWQDAEGNEAPIGTEEDPINVADVTLTGVIPTTIGDGRKTVTSAGTAVKLTETSTPCQYVIITAIATNTGAVVVGGSTVVAASATRRGKPLTVSNSVGESITIPIDDVSKVYVDSVNNNEGVVYTYLN